MHPILFEIPLPERPVSLLYLFLGIAAILALLAGYSFLRSTRGSAALFGVFGAGGVVAAIQYSGQTWDMGPVPIYSYGVMLGLSLVVGWYLTLGLAERDGLPKELMANCYVVTAIAAVAGSRILYVVTNLDEFETFGSIFAMRSGGLVAYGGFLGGFVGSYLFLRNYKLELLPWADVAVPSLASGLMITRIGCYLFGCDFGRPLTETAPQWLKDAGTFPHWMPGTLENGDGAPAWVQHVKEHGLSPTATHSLPVHPTQLYESALGLVLLIVLLAARRHQKFRGQIFLIFTFAYGYARFLVETLRDDPERNSIPPSMSQHILLPLCLAAMAIAFSGGVARMIENPTVRRVAQALSFLPAVIAYFMMRPETFAGSVRIELSTSQFIGLASAVGAGIAFSMFYKAALKNPAAAMALRIPPELLDDGKGSEVADEDEDEDEDKPRKKGKAAAKVAAKGGKKAKGKKGGKKGTEKKETGTATVGEAKVDPKGKAPAEGKADAGRADVGKADAKGKPAAAVVDDDDDDDDDDEKSDEADKDEGGPSATGDDGGDDDEKSDDDDDEKSDGEKSDDDDDEKSDGDDDDDDDDEKGDGGKR